MVVANVIPGHNSSGFPSTNSTSLTHLAISPLVAHNGFQDAEKKCELLGPVGLVVQGCMGVLVVLSLVIKRQYEGDAKKGIPKRRWKVWSMDVGKQLFGQGFVHFLNVWISAGLASHDDDINPCSLYFLNVLVDTTIGVLFLYLALKSFTWLCEKTFGAAHGFRSGIYGNPPKIKPFFLQLAIYLLALTLMKLAVILLFYFTAEEVLLPFAGWLIGWMEEDLQVVVVMAVFPLIMNVLQFCLVDSLIKGSSAADESSTNPSALKDTEDSEDNLEGGQGERSSSRSNSRNRCRSSEESDQFLSPLPASPSSSARAPLLTTASRRASPFSSPKNSSIVLSVVLAMLFVLPGAMASSGDRHPVFQSCLQTCVNQQCGSDSPPLDKVLRLLNWSCSSDCAYQCSHSVTSAFVSEGERLHQFYGKWAFWRFAGIQEPASVMFSLGNGWVHYKGWKKARGRIKNGSGINLKSWILGLALVQMNTWFWSAIFHTRDTPFTEKMDYFSATATIMYTLYYTLIRTFHLFPQYPNRPRGSPALYYLGLVFCIAYIAHISYLLSGPRFDYGWNILFNLVIGTTHLLLWSLFSLSFSVRLPGPFSWIPTPYPPLDPLTITPKPKWSGTSAILVMATTAAMSLELFDFPPYYRVIDAHSLWHLATIFIARGWYGFLIRDAAMLEAVRAGMSGGKAGEVAEGSI